MILITKCSEPQELIQEKRDGLTEYSDMTIVVKDAIRKQLLKEQGHLCAYCMRRIKHDSMQIEHYNAQHPIDEPYDVSSTIDYGNMLGVCQANAGTPFKIQTCEQHRGNTSLTINPLKQSTITEIKYVSNGHIKSDVHAINQDLNQTLNLNCSESLLPKNRKAALDALKKSLYRDYKEKALPVKDRKERILDLKNHNNGNLNEFVGILIWYLEKHNPKPR